MKFTIEEDGIDGVSLGIIHWQDGQLCCCVPCLISWSREIEGIMSTHVLNTVARHLVGGEESH